MESPFWIFLFSLCLILWPNHVPAASCCLEYPFFVAFKMGQLGSFSMMSIWLTQNSCRSFSLSNCGLWAAPKPRPLSPSCSQLKEVQKANHLLVYTNILLIMGWNSSYTFVLSKSLGGPLTWLLGEDWTPTPFHGEGERKIKASCSGKWIRLLTFPLLPPLPTIAHSSICAEWESCHGVMVVG